MQCVDSVLQLMQRHVELSSLLESRSVIMHQWVTLSYRKEVGHMVPKRSVVGMLLECHNLDGVVAKLANARQHGHAEVQVAVDARLLA